MTTFRCGGCAGVVRVGDGPTVACKRCGHVNVCPTPADSTPSGWERRPGGDSRTFWLAGGAVVLVLVAFVGWATIRPAQPQAASGTGGSAAEVRQRQLLEINLDKPGDATLGQLFASINSRHFSGGLKPIPVRWEPRLNEVGALAGGGFTLEGMYGYVGSRSMILLNTALRENEAALRRALCHEMVHAQLHAEGRPTEEHGPPFQTILRRLSAENAFEGIVATDEERANLRAWLDAESRRLDSDQESIKQETSDINRERMELETLLSNLDARAKTASPPDLSEISSFNARRDRYNWRVGQLQTRVEQDRNDRAQLHREVERYNLMVIYPDGLGGEAFRIKK